MRAGRSDQSYLESGTNVQLVIAAISVDGREKKVLTFKIVGNNAHDKAGGVLIGQPELPQRR